MLTNLLKDATTLSNFHRDNRLT